MSYLSNTLGRYTGNSSMRDKGLIQQITGDVPEVKTNINLEPETRKTIAFAASALGGGILLNGVLNYLATK